MVSEDGVTKDEQLAKFDGSWRVLLANDDRSLTNQLLKEGKLEKRKPSGRTPAMYRWQQEQDDCPR